MRTTYLLAGLSAIALATTTAQAQTNPDNTNIINSVGENNVFVCANGQAPADGGFSSTGNVCTIDQVGDNNRAVVNQRGNRNVSDIDQVGSGNRAFHVQVGLENLADTDQVGQDNQSNIRQNSNATLAQADASANLAGNQARVSQFGGPAAGVDLAGVTEAHISNVDQGARLNVASVTQAGVGQQSTVIQAQVLDAVTGAVVAGFANSISNSATVIQGGARTESVVFQGVNGEGSNNVATNRVNNNGAPAYAGTTNISRIDQQSNANIASVTVSGGERTGLVRDDTGPAGVDAGTDPDVVTGANRSDVVQRGGAANEVDVFLGRSPQELQALGTLRGNNQRSDIDQNGRDNLARVTITGGLAGENITTDPTPGQNSEINRSGGNTATIDQIGAANTVDVNTGNSRNLTGNNPRGFGNSVTITQTATQNYQNQGAARDNVTVTASQDRLGYREFDTGPGSRNFTGANGNYVETWQQGRFDTATVIQTDRVNTEAGAAGPSGSGFVYSDGSIGRARAGIYQDSSVGTVNITQNGDNYGEVTQGDGSEIFVTTGSVVNLTQTDTGDGTRASTAGETQVLVDQFGNPGQNVVPAGALVPVRQYNQAILTQNGGGQRMDVTQEARNGYVAAFQRNDLAQAPLPAPNQARGQTVDANNTLDLQQGTARSNLQAGFTTGGTNAITAAGATAGAAVNPTMNVLQGGRNNGTQVSQDSSNSFVVVTQLGTGAAAAPAPNNFPAPGATAQGGAPSANIIIVAQQGTGNRAEAAQEATVTASGNCGALNVNCPASGAGLANEFVFAGGPRSSEINIFQGGSSNTAVAVQRGAGQYARIEQAGSNNRAAIEQQQAATNATAVIRQTGSNNSYTIVQTLPGQYNLVNQTGNNNTTGVFSGPQGNTTFAPATFTRPSGT